MALASVPPVDPDDAPRRKRGWGWGFWVAVGWIVGLGTVLVLAPVLPLDDPDSVGSAFFAKPGEEGFLFGSDELGRDLFSRVLWGGRVSLSIGVVSLVFGFFIGGFIGITAGFVLVNFAVDLLYGFLDPRVRHARSS